MKLRQSIFCALLLAVGYVLHVVVTPLLGGMKPDLLLSMLFISLLLVDDVQINLQTGFLAGLIAALTTSFPGGQIPNLIDKIAVTLLLIVVLKLVRSRLPRLAAGALITALGTLISGGVFLASAQALSGLPAPFAVLFAGVVLPAALANTGITLLVLKVLRPVLSSGQMSAYIYGG